MLISHLINISMGSKPQSALPQLHDNKAHITKPKTGHSVPFSQCFKLKCELGQRTRATNKSSRR